MNSFKFKNSIFEKADDSIISATKKGYNSALSEIYGKSAETAGKGIGIGYEHLFNSMYKAYKSEGIKKIE